MAISPDSFLVASGDSEGTLKLWILHHALGENFMVDYLLLYTKTDAHAGGTLALDFSPEHSIDTSRKFYARLPLN